jgi:hypothetical protein
VDVIAGMPDNLFAHVGWDFRVSQPRNNPAPFLRK